MTYNPDTEIRDGGLRRCARCRRQTGWIVHCHWNNRDSRKCELCKGTKTFGRYPCPICMLQPLCQDDQKCPLWVCENCHDLCCTCDALPGWRWWARFKAWVRDLAH